MDDKPNYHHLSTTKPSSLPVHHHASTPGRKHDEVAGMAFVVPPHGSTTPVHDTHYKTGSTAVPHAILIPSSSTTSSGLPTISSLPSIAKLPKTTTSLQSIQPSSIAATPNAQSSRNNNAAGILGPVLGAVAGLIVVGSVFLWLFLRRRKRNQRSQRLDSLSSSPDNGFNHPDSTMEKGANRVMMLASRGNKGTFPASSASVNYSTTSLQPAMTRDAKRLTADTFVSADRRSSLSTMVSKKQYMPQLAYSPSGIDKNDILCVSPSNTLIDGFSIATDDDEKKQQQQRVPSYQPQIVMDTDAEMQNYYDYITTTTNNNNNNDGRSPNNHQQQPRGESPQ